MSNRPNPSRTRRSAAAGLLGAVAALAAITGAGPAPSLFQLTGASEDVSGNCDEPEHFDDVACGGTPVQDGTDDSSTSSTIEDGSSTSTTGATSPSSVRTVTAGDAGSIMVAVDGASLSLLAASPNQGWQVEVEQSSGTEIEVTFRSGTVRVDVNVEFEDGQVRERVRIRDDADDSELRFENGVLVRSESGDDLDDDSSGSGSDDDSDDNSSGSDSDDSDDSDDDSDDDGPDDDSDDDSGHGSDDSDDGSDDDGPDHD